MSGGSVPPCRRAWTALLNRAPDVPCAPLLVCDGEACRDVRKRTAVCTHVHRHVRCVCSLHPNQPHSPATIGVPDTRLISARPRSEFHDGPKTLRGTCGEQGSRVMEPGAQAPYRGLCGESERRISRHLTSLLGQSSRRTNICGLAYPGLGLLPLCQRCHRTHTNRGHVLQADAPTAESAYGQPRQRKHTTPLPRAAGRTCAPKTRVLRRSRALHGSTEERRSRLFLPFLRDCATQGRRSRQGDLIGETASNATVEQSPCLLQNE